MDEPIKDRIIRAHPDDALDEMKRTLNGYRHFGRRIYIGVTAWPEERWSQHEPDGWRQMVLLYEAYTAEIARRLERELIDYARRCRYPVEIGNIGMGGEGLSKTRKEHYVYFLVE